MTLIHQDTKMAGESQLKEQAKTQWERLDLEGLNLIKGILITGTEEVEWQTNAEPKFQKKGQQNPSGQLTTQK